MDSSQVFFLIDIGEDMIKLDDWTPSSSDIGEYGIPYWGEYVQLYRIDIKGE